MFLLTSNAVMRFEPQESSASPVQADKLRPAIWLSSQYSLRRELHPVRSSAVSWLEDAYRVCMLLQPVTFSEVRRLIQQNNA